MEDNSKPAFLYGIIAQDTRGGKITIRVVVVVLVVVLVVVVVVVVCISLILHFLRPNVTKLCPNVTSLP